MDTPEVKRLLSSMLTLLTLLADFCGDKVYGSVVSLVPIGSFVLSETFQALGFLMGLELSILILMGLEFSILIITSKLVTGAIAIFLGEFATSGFALKHIIHSLEWYLCVTVHFRSSIH